MSSLGSPTLDQRGFRGRARSAGALTTSVEPSPSFGGSGSPLRSCSGARPGHRRTYSYPHSGRDPGLPSRDLRRE